MKKLMTAAALLTTLTAAAQWQPAGDRIKTPWSEKLDPEHVLAEYPRPQMVRAEWLNLNGLWNYAICSAGEQPVPGGDAGRPVRPGDAEAEKFYENLI